MSSNKGMEQTSGAVAEMEAPLAAHPQRSAHKRGTARRTMMARCRALTLLLPLFGVILVAPAAAQPPVTARDEPATKFERFMLSKGTVRVREYYEIGTLRGSLGSATFQVARAYTPGQRDYLLALQIQVTEAGRLNRDRTGVLDADEVASLAAAIPQMTRMAETLRQGQEAQNTEVDFKGGSIQVTFFVSKRGGSREGVAIKAGEIGSVTTFFEIGDLAKIADLLTQASAKIRELQQKR